jgi:hypothetical protein
LRHYIQEVLPFLGTKFTELWKSREVSQEVFVRCGKPIAKKTISGKTSRKAQNQAETTCRELKRPL